MIEEMLRIERSTWHVSVVRRRKLKGVSCRGRESERPFSLPIRFASGLRSKKVGLCFKTFQKERGFLRSTRCSFLGLIVANQVVEESRKKAKHLECVPYLDSSELSMFKNEVLLA